MLTPTGYGDVAMKVQVRQPLEAPSDTVFRDVGDFGNLARLDVVAACTVEGNGVGAVRTVTFTDPTLGRVVERLESYDPIVRTFSYSIINEDCVLPVTNYLATVRVIEDGPTACLLEWGSEFQLRDMEEPEARRMFEGFYMQAIDAARRAVEKP